MPVATPNASAAVNDPDASLPNPLILESITPLNAAPLAAGIEDPPPPPPDEGMRLCCRLTIDERLYQLKTLTIPYRV